MNTPLSKSLRLGTRSVNPSEKSEPFVYIPKSFPERDSEGKAIDPFLIFKPSEIRYLDALHRGEDPEKAIQSAGFDQKQVMRLLKTRKAKTYLAELLRQRLAVEGWNQDKWLHEGIKVWEEEKKVSREQMEAWKELGARIAPKTESGGVDRPTIVINVGLAEAALKRQEVIEGEVIESKPSHP